MKEEHFKMLQYKIISEYTLKCIKLCHFKNNSQGKCTALNIQYTERSNYFSRLFMQKNDKY